MRHRHGRQKREEMREEERRSWEEMDIREHMDLYLSRGMDQKAAMKAVAKDRRIGKAGRVPDGAGGERILKTRAYYGRMTVIMGDF